MICSARPVGQCLGSGVARVVVGFFLTTKAATSCPPLILADLWRQLASRCLAARSARPAHGRARSGWHAACPSTCPAPPRSRFVVARTTSCLSVRAMERFRPSDSEATLLQLGRPALRMSSKHEEVALSSSRTTARNHPRQCAKVHLLASEISLCLPDVRSACAVTGRQ